jgi:uncharacterized protein (TIGR02145 family)
MTMLLWPVAVAAQGLTVCTSTSYTVPSAEGVTDATYKWLENGVEIPGANDESYTNLAGKGAAGTYVYVRMAYTEACKWNNSNAFIVSVTGSVDAPVISKPADGCQGGSYVFTVPVVADATYEWTGGGTANSNSYTYASAAAGALTVTVRTVTAACSSAASGATATAYARPTFTAQPTKTQAICPGTTTLSVTTDNATAYQWKKDGVNVGVADGSGGTTSNYTTAWLKANATYTVVASNGVSACSATSNDAEITILTVGCYTAPGATVDFSAFDPDPNADKGSTWTLRDTRAGGNSYTYIVKLMKDGRYWMVQDLMFGSCIATWYNDDAAGKPAHQPTVYADASTTYVGHCRQATVSASNKTVNLYNWAGAMNNANGYYSSGDATFECTGRSAGTLEAKYPANCRGICPEGWHIPTGGAAGEFQDLFEKLGGTVGASSSNVSAVLTNFGFNSSSITYDTEEQHWHGVLGGLCYSNGSLSDQDSAAFYWTSTYANTYSAYHIGSSKTYLSIQAYSTNPDKTYGFSVRCVRNY